jgi:ubiquinone/menaquinone biosynthesis C-methylase UbiE
MALEGLMERVSEHARRSKVWTPEGSKIVAYAGVSHGEPVLDVGSGFGDVTESAIRKGAFVVSVDFSRTYLKTLTTRVPDAMPILSDARHLPIRSQHFRKVISKFVWHNIPSATNRNQFIRECARVLDAGGLLVLSRIPTTLHQIRCFLIRNIFHRALRISSASHREGPYYHFFRYAEVWRILDAHGMRITGAKPSEVYPKLNHRHKRGRINALLSLFYGAFFLTNKIPVLEIIHPALSGFELDIQAKKMLD